MSVSARLPARPVAPAAGGSGTGRGTPWPVVWAVAAATAVPPIVALLVVVGAPTGTQDRLAFAGPVVVGAAVVLSRVRVEAGAVALGLALVFLTAPGNAALESEALASTAGISLYLGVCWVTCSIGLRLPWGPAAGWLAVVLLAALVGTGFDVPILLGSGWWLVGRALRDRQLLADRLRARAAELAAEQDRFADEAVRLERARIARELHDVVAHCMTVIVIQARAAQQQPACAPDALAAIAGAADEVAGDLDTLVRVLESDRHPLSRAVLGALIGRIADSGVDAAIEVRGDPADLPAPCSAVGHRAIQEALTNALRHAPGGWVRVEVDCTDGLAAMIENGPGVDDEPVTVGSGRGLPGLRDRVRELGGMVRWGPTPAGGWRLDLTLR